MAQTHPPSSSETAYPFPAAIGSPKLHFSLLTQAEKASFEAGLYTRLWNRVFEAVKAPTAGAYEVARTRNITPYFHLLELLRLETAHAAEPVTDADVMRALDQVEGDLGEAWRHKLEHAINVSQASLQVMARVQDRTRGVASPDAAESMLWIMRWVTGWMSLNWTMDCVFAATDRRVIAQPEVVAKVFEELREAANGVYAAACEAHDARFGDPDDGE